MNLREKHLQSALKDLDKKRQENQNIARQRYQLVCEKAPEIAKIRQTLAEQTSYFFQETMRSPEKKAEFTEALQNLQAQTDQAITTLLANHHLPNDYLQPVYDCPHCQDTGFLPNLNACLCLKKAFIEKAYQQSNLAPALASQNFDSFSFEVYGTEKNKTYGISPRENMHTIFEECHHFAAAFGQNYQNLLLNGPSGLGKTFLCNCIAKEVLEQGFLVIYLSAPEFFGFFEKYHFHHGETEIDYGFIQSIYDCDLLIIDDLGTEVITSVTQSDLFQTLNRRINDQKATVISTNLSIAQLSKTYSERTISRLLGEYTPLLFFGDDIRKKRYL